jgi:hypothetical protein
MLSYDAVYLFCLSYFCADMTNLVTQYRCIYNYFVLISIAKSKKY